MPKKNNTFLLRYYGVFEREADFPFNFDLLEVGRGGNLDKDDILNRIKTWMFNMPDQAGLNINPYAIGI